MQRTRRHLVIVAVIAAGAVTIGLTQLVPDRDTTAIRTAGAARVDTAAVPATTATHAAGAPDHGAQLIVDYTGVELYLAQLEADRLAAEEAERARIAAELEAAAAEEQRRLAAAATPAPPQQQSPPQVQHDEPPAGDCVPGNPYASFIYQRESGCRTWAYNAGGCRGLGQACPGSKLPCNDDDFACQHEWFEGYALGRYGSWEAAYAFWLRNHWW